MYYLFSGNTTLFLLFIAQLFRYIFIERNNTNKQTKEIKNGKKRKKEGEKVKALSNVFLFELFVAQCKMHGAIKNGASTLVKSGAVHSGQMQCILVKSDEFENSS